MLRSALLFPHFNPQTSVRGHLTRLLNDQGGTSSEEWSLFTASNLVIDTISVNSIAELPICILLFSSCELTQVTWEHRDVQPQACVDFHRVLGLYLSQ